MTDPGPTQTPPPSDDGAFTVEVTILPYWHKGAAFFALRKVLDHVRGYRLSRGEYLVLLRYISIMESPEIEEIAL